MSRTTMTSPDAPDSAPDPPLGDPAPGVPRSGPGLVLAVSAAVVLAIVAVVLGVLLATRDDGSDATDLRRAAGRFAEALVTYDHRDPDAHRDAVLRFATGSFREEYEAAFDDGLALVITEVEAVSTGFVNDVFISEVDEERASAVVSVDIAHDGTGGERTLRDIYFRLAFVHVDGAWKVDRVTDLSFASAPAAPPGLGEAGADVTADTTTSTSTSVP